jgi:periplasmic protein TonB
MIFDRLISKGNDRGLLYSGLAAGAMHMFVAAVALCLVINGMQKTSKALTVHLIDSEISDAPKSNGEQQRSEVTAAVSSKKVKTRETISRSAPASQPVTDSKEASVVSIGATQYENVRSRVSSGVSASTSDRGATATVRFGSSSGPQFLRREIPEYPFIAKRMNKEGKVLLKLSIDENGRLLKVEVVEAAEFGFTEAALEAVRKSRYRPAVRNGKAIFSKALLPVRFKLAGHDDI